MAKLLDDKKVIDLFLDKKPGESKKLTSDGTRLDGNWMGGKGLAVWKNGKIQLPDSGGKIGQSYQSMVRKAAPKNWIGESMGFDQREMAILESHSGLDRVKSRRLEEGNSSADAKKALLDFGRKAAGVGKEIEALGMYIDSLEEHPELKAFAKEITAVFKKEQLFERTPAIFEKMFHDAAKKADGMKG